MSVKRQLLREARQRELASDRKVREKVFSQSCKSPVRKKPGLGRNKARVSVTGHTQQTTEWRAVSRAIHIWAEKGKPAGPEAMTGKTVIKTGSEFGRLTDSEMAIVQADYPGCTVKRNGEVSIPPVGWTGPRRKVE